MLSLEKFKIITRTLLSGQALDKIHRDQRLIGSHIERHECHIESDLLLIHKMEERQIIFERMGRHSDLFKK
ncbi:MAG: type II toxin-antitoxin system mRNA interferase toxin, RelE/StbE family [Candidatus Aminicenantes bacterium]|nr:type II toxin-antitoxin system mRNA interferase toxin, RelE/StbE family [Candidatus Aminicenantes bacterium]